MLRALTSRCARAWAMASALVLMVTGLTLNPSQYAFATGGHRTLARSAAPTSLAELRADVSRTSDRLAAATVAWERGQRQLGILIQRRIGTGAAADQLQVDAQAAHDRVAALAASLYRNPVDPMLTAVLSGDTYAITDVMFVRRALRQTSNDWQQDATLLNSLAQQTRSLLQSQDAAASAAIRLQAQLDGDLTRLQNDAQASLVRLQSAVAEVRRREAAAAAAALGAQGAGSGASCTGGVPADAINGFLPGSALCPLKTAPGQRLIASAASAFDAMSTAFAAEFGTSLCVTDSYRDYATQVQVFTRKPNLAATPGRSQHGWGRAVDLCGGVQNYGTPPYNWLKQHAIGFGFGHPDWAEPDGSRPEPWHWEFQT